MKHGKRHKILKNWRTSVGLVAAFAVVLAGITMAQPRQARAVCETPASAVATLGIWLANSLGLLGDFGGALTDYLMADVQTGQDETEKRIDDFNYNTREGWGRWWNEGALPSLREKSKQLSTGTLDETRMRGSMMDADAHAERTEAIQDAQNEEMTNSDLAMNACTADSVLGGGGDGTGAGGGGPARCTFNSLDVANGWRGNFSNSCPNGERTVGFRECCDGTVHTHYTSICGEDQPDVQAQCSSGSGASTEGNAGMVYSVEMTNDITRALAEESSQRAVASAGTPEAKGMPAVIADKWDRSQPYCDPQSNGGTIPCANAADPELINKDVEIGSALLWGDGMTIDINEPKFQTLLLDAERAFVDQTPASAIPTSVMGQPAAIKQFNLTRSTAARKQAVHAVVGGLMATRIARPDIEPLPEVQEIRQAAGVAQENTTDKPSVHEITHALFQERYTKPEFVTQIVQDPEQLVKENLDIQTGYLMQWNMMYKNMEKLAVLYASEFAQDLEDSEPDFVANRGTDPYDGERYIIDDDNDGVVEECEIVDFVIPDNPFGCPNQTAALALTGMEGEFITPVVGYPINSGFGSRAGGGVVSHNHKGVDIAAPTGTPIYASAGGTVIAANYSSSYGNLIYIDHGNGIVTRYAHMSGYATGIAVGTVVTQGQNIGFVGSTGNSTGPHLHFEIRVNGTAVDPTGYLVDAGGGAVPTEPHDEDDPDHSHGAGMFDAECGGPTGIGFNCDSIEGQTPRPASDMALSDQYIEDIMQSEGFENCKYRDSAGLWTIGIGHLIRPSENFPNCITDEQVRDIYRQDNAVAEADVKRCVTAPLTQNQYEALVSLSFNLGGPQFCGSTLVRLLNQGDYAGAQQAFGDWIYAGGRVVQGLVNRRQREAALFGACQ